MRWSSSPSPTPRNCSLYKSAASAAGGMSSLQMSAGSNGVRLADQLREAVVELVDRSHSKSMDEKACRIRRDSDDARIAYLTLQVEVAGQQSRHGCLATRARALRCGKCAVQHCNDDLVTQAMLRTDRLELVPLSGEHLELEVELDSDPEVMRYLTGHGRTREQVVTTHRLRMETAEPVPGLGFWVGFRDGDFVGWWLLEPLGWADRNVVEGQAELGYRLLRRYWRQGLASEGSRELLRHAFEELHLQRVSALTMTVNTASRATMTAIGLEYVRTFFVDDEGPAGIEHGGVEYAITRDAWRVADSTPNRHASPSH